VQVQDRIRHAFRVLQLQNAARSVTAGQQARVPSAGARTYSCCHSTRRTTTPAARSCVSRPALGTKDQNGLTTDRVSPATGWQRNSARHPAKQGLGLSAVGSPGNAAQDRQHVKGGKLHHMQRRPQTARPFRVRTQMLQEADRGFKKVLCCSCCCPP
jgi:hypothetical protein